MGNACPPAVIANIIYVELFVVFMILSGCSVPLRNSIFLVFKMTPLETTLEGVAPENILNYDETKIQRIPKP